MTSINQKVVISLGNSVFSNSIVQKEITITKLFNQLSKPTIQHKKDGKYFIFASFTDNTRNAKNVKQYYGATIDLDDTSLSLDQIRNKFKRHPHCIYTTFSHKEKGDRYRLVLPYKMPLDSATHVETMLYLMNLLGAKDVDMSSKALSRPMYLPACPKERQKYAEFFKEENGLLFNPMSPKVREEVSALYFEQSELHHSITEKFDINENVDEGGRNDALARAIGKMIKTGVANTDLLGLAITWNQVKLNPPLSDKEVKTVVESIIKAHSRNSDDLDWGYEEILNRIKQSKNIDTDYDHILDMIVLGKTKGKIKPSQIQIIINKMNEKAKVGKRTILQEITSKELELIGKLEDASDASFESAAKTLKEDFVDWVYVASDDRVYNLKTGEYFKREAFSAMFATPSIEGSLFGLIMKFNLMKKVSRLEFDPSQDEIYIKRNIRYGNTYIPPEIFPLPGNIDPILNHFEYLIPEDYERGIILDFIAHLVQRPGEKIRWMPVIKGGKGIGKTIIAETIIMPIIGFTNFGKVSNEVIRSDFNAWQLDKQLVVFEELDIGDNYKEKERLTDSLKSFITDNILTAHRKGLDPYDTINKANALGFTNKEDAIIISMDERRFCMIRTNVKPKPDRYYAKLAKFVENNLPAVYHFFLERDLSNFTPLRAPETSYTKEVKALSMSWPGSIINEWIHNDDHPIYQARCATFKTIVDTIYAESTGRYKAVAEDLQSPGSAQSRKLHHTLHSLGFVKYENRSTRDGRLRVAGQPSNVWILPDAVKELNTPEAAKKIAKLAAKVKVIDHNWAH